MVGHETTCSWNGLIAKLSVFFQLIQAPAKVRLLSIQTLIKEHNIQTHKVSVEVPDKETEADEDSEDEANTYDTEASGNSCNHRYHDGSGICGKCRWRVTWAH